MGKVYGMNSKDAHVVDKSSFEYKMNYNPQGKGSKPRYGRPPAWHGLEEIGRSSRMVEFRVNDHHTRFVALKEVLAWESKNGK
jgi:hypothetical protein